MPPDVNPLTHSFIPIAFMVGMSVMTGVGILMLSWFLGGGRTSEAGNTIYECGLDPMDEAHVKFPVKFYVVAMIFILFDVEIALLYPWAIFFGDAAGTPATRMLGLIELLVFTGVLVVGYVYLYKAGAFDWVESVRGQQRLKDIARERASNAARDRATGARDGAATPGRAA